MFKVDTLRSAYSDQDKSNNGLLVSSLDYEGRGNTKLLSMEAE